MSASSTLHSAARPYTETTPASDQPSPHAGDPPRQHRWGSNAARVQQEALAYILTLATDCHMRGGHTPDETEVFQQHMQAHMQVLQHAGSTEHETLKPCTSTSSYTASLAWVLQHLHRAQRLGVLTLHEAWAVYNAQQLLCGDGRGVGGVGGKEKVE